MKLESLQDLLMDELKDLYDAEKQIVKALPKMAEKASNPKLKTAFEDHLKQTRGHVDRLEQVFELLDEKPRAKHCAGMEGLLEEGKKMLKEDAEPGVMDAALIAGAQRVEHYEMAAYGSVRTFARQLGKSNVAEILQQTLTEEGETDHKLSRLAESSVNLKAAAA